MPIWLLTTKSWESPQFPCVQVVCNIPLKSSRRGLQICFKLHLNHTSTHKVMGPQNYESPTLGISRLPFGSLETKWHLGASPVVRHKIYYKGKGGGFPQLLDVVSFISLCLLVVHSCTKMFQLRNNQFVVWFVWFVWAIELLVNLPSPISKL